TFQWFKGAVGSGTAITGETLPFYTLAAPKVSDNNTKYYCVITQGSTVLTSTAATLTVQPDVTPPTIIAVGTRGNPNAIEVTFSEPVDATSAGLASNYSCNNGVTISAATVVNSTLVRLTTSTMVEGRIFILTVNNV